MKLYIQCYTIKRKISINIFVGPLVRELHYLFMNGLYNFCHSPLICSCSARCNKCNSELSKVFKQNSQMYCPSNPESFAVSFNFGLPK